MRRGYAGIAPAMGVIVPAITLVAGLHMAKADELADLRANQELLQRRIDQLAQAQNVGAGSYFSNTPNPAVGAGAAGGSFPRSFLIPGTDTSIRVGGEIDEVLDYWLSGGPVNSSPQTTTVGANGQTDAAPLDIHGQTVGGAPVGVAIAHSRGNGIFSQSPRQSKINFETRTPTAYGEARTFMEFDWAGSNQFVPGGSGATSGPTDVSDNLLPRLKFAYGTLGGFLAGQANSNFSDPDANAETLDFGGNVGEPGVVRIPQIRYTMPLPWSFGGALSVSAETPETDVGTPAGIIASDSPSSALPAGLGLPGTIGGVCTGTATVAGTSCATTTPVLTANPAKAISPDLTAAFYLPQAWGHFDASGVVRPGLDVEDGKFISRQFIGYGGHLGFDAKPGWFGWAKDDVTVQVVGGDGIGRYLNERTNFSLATNFLSTPGTTAAAALILIHPVVAFGGEVGYQHWWMPNLRSNISVGLNHQDIRSNLVGVPQDEAMNKELVTAHANLIWSPVSFVDMGIEYMYGHRQVIANLKGDENVLISKLAFKF